MCNEAVRNCPWLSHKPDHLRTQETCNEVIQAMPKCFIWISERLKKRHVLKTRKIVEVTDSFFFNFLIRKGPPYDTPRPYLRSVYKTIKKMI